GSRRPGRGGGGPPPTSPRWARARRGSLISTAFQGPARTRTRARWGPRPDPSPRTSPATRATSCQRKRARGPPECGGSVRRGGPGASGAARAGGCWVVLLFCPGRGRGCRAAGARWAAAGAGPRRSHRRQRVRQLKLLREMRVRLGSPPRSAEDDALLLFTLERVCDAAADGELRDLGLSTAAMVRRLEGLVRAQLGA